MREEPEFSFTGSADSLNAGRDLVARTRPDILLLDVMLPDGNGLDLIADVKRLSPHTRVVVLTSFTDEHTLERSIESGAIGFASKCSSLSELLATLRQASRGEMVMPTGLLVGLLKRVPRDKNASYLDDNGWEHLTLREREVLERLALGLPGEKIADELCITPLTVRTHIRNLMSKLGVHSRLEAVTFAMRKGLIEPPP